MPTYSRAAAVLLTLSLLTPALLVPIASRAEGRVADAKCDPARLQGRNYSECLRKALDDSEKSLAAAIAAVVVAVDRAPNTPAQQKQRWKRGLDESQALWARFRNTECQDVAPFEMTDKARIFEERNACMIDRNAERAESLKRRYP